MALKKKVIQDDGVTTEYHRILYVSNGRNREQRTWAVLY